MRADEDSSVPPLDPAATRARLLDCRVLVVGVGGLGTPAALGLAAAGIGTLGLVDGDRIELSNLHRQITYRTADVGAVKVDAAAAALRARAPDVRLECVDAWLSADNLATLFSRFDFVIDGTDRAATKFLVNDGAVAHGVPFSHAGIVGFQGQIMTVLPGRSACLRCLFPTPPADDDVPACAEAGVLGPLAGTFGALQATEAVKYLTGAGALLANRLLTCDAARARWREVTVSRQPGCAVCGNTAALRGPGAVANPRGSCE